MLRLKIRQLISIFRTLKLLQIGRVEVDWWLLELDKLKDQDTHKEDQ